MPPPGGRPLLGFDYKSEIFELGQRNQIRLAWDSGSRLNRALASDTGTFFLVWPALPPWRERDGTLSTSQALVTPVHVWEVRLVLYRPLFSS